MPGGAEIHLTLPSLLLVVPRRRERAERRAKGGEGRRPFIPSAPTCLHATAAPVRVLRSVDALAWLGLGSSSTRTISRRVRGDYHPLPLVLPAQSGRR